MPAQYTTARVNLVLLGFPSSSTSLMFSMRIGSPHQGHGGQRERRVVARAGVVVQRRVDFLQPVRRRAATDPEPDREARVAEASSDPGAAAPRARTSASPRGRAGRGSSRRKRVAEEDRDAAAFVRAALAAKRRRSSVNAIEPEVGLGLAAAGGEVDEIGELAGRRAVGIRLARPGRFISTNASWNGRHSGRLPSA